MARYSRTAKYEELRNRLQNDSETEVRSSDLSPYANRLNRIDSENFAPMKDIDQSHDPIHARRREYLDQTAAMAASKGSSQENPAAIASNENDLATFDNEYLDKYINEVKQYNVEQGNAVNTNTEMNILAQLQGQRPAPKKPYADEPVTQKKLQQPNINTQNISNTADIPFISSMRGDTTADLPVQNTAAQERVKTPFLDEDETDDTVSDTKTFTKEDIATEVQNLVNSNSKSVGSDTMNQHLEAERTARQQLLNETTQMRAQLDDYEDNLSDVSDKVKHTNRILNFVLVVLILALLVVLGIVVYWIFLSKGVVG